MKVFLILMVSTFLSIAHADEFVCDKEGEAPQIIVSLDQGKGNFQYVIDSKAIMDLRIPDDNIFWGNEWETDRKYINFNPGWGESTVNIYARVSEKISGSLFDIYATGMIVGNEAIIQTLSGYTCNKR